MPSVRQVPTIFQVGLGTGRIGGAGRGILCVLVQTGQTCPVVDIRRGKRIGTGFARDKHDSLSSEHAFLSEMFWHDICWRVTGTGQLV